MRRLFGHRRELSERELAAVRDGVRAGVAEALRDIISAAPWRPA